MTTTDKHTTADVELWGKIAGTVKTAKPKVNTKGDVATVHEQIAILNALNKG